MILLPLPAKISCDHEGCVATEPAQLALTVRGGFTFKPTSGIKDWQIGAHPAGVILNFCPKHTQKVISPVLQG